MRKCCVFISHSKFYTNLTTVILLDYILATEFQIYTGCVLTRTRLLKCGVWTCRRWGQSAVSRASKSSATVRQGADLVRDEDYDNEEEEFLSQQREHNDDDCGRQHRRIYRHSALIFLALGRELFALGRLLSSLSVFLIALVNSIRFILCRQNTASTSRHRVGRFCCAV